MCDNLDVAEINIPDEIGKTASTVIDGSIVFVTTEHDDNPSNPLEDMDAEGRIYSFNSRHINSGREEVQEALADPDKVLLSYFEHGLCKWDVAGTMTGMPDFQWDGTLHAGVWVPDQATLDEANGSKLKGKKRAEFMAGRAADACKLYTDFCNGAVYYYDVRAYIALRTADGETLDLLSDYRHSHPVFEDSCGGFYGDESFQEALKEAASEALNAVLAPSKAEPAAV